jgi:hypothetical protein
MARHPDQEVRRMSTWKYRVIAVPVGLLGVGLIGLVWWAMYVPDRAGEKLMFAMGMPVVLLATLAGGLLIGVAGLLLAPASHWRLGPR